MENTGNGKPRERRIVKEAAVEGAGEVSNVCAQGFCEMLRQKDDN